MAKSALIRLYRMSKYDIPIEFADNLKIFVKGMKQHVAAKKWRMGTAESLVRIRKKLDFKVYEKM